MRRAEVRRGADASSFFYHLIASLPRLHLVRQEPVLVPCVCVCVCECVCVCVQATGTCSDIIHTHTHTHTHTHLCSPPTRHRLAATDASWSWCLRSASTCWASASPAQSRPAPPQRGRHGRRSGSAASEARGGTNSLPKRRKPHIRTRQRLSFPSCCERSKATHSQI